MCHRQADAFSFAVPAAGFGCDQFGPGKRRLNFGKIVNAALGEPLMSGEATRPGRGLPAKARDRKSKVRIVMKKILVLSLACFTVAAYSARAEDAKAIYEKDCLKCHGADGKGDTKMGKKLGAKDYSDAKVQAELKDENAIKAIKEGLKDKEGKSLMKPAEGLSDEDIKGLVAYMRKFKQ